MSRLLKACAVVAFILMFSFMTIGYAQVTTRLTITGTVSKPQFFGVYIVEGGVNVTSTTNGAVVDESKTLYYQSVMNTTITLGSNANSSVTFKITVHNNTDTTYAFDKTSHSVYSNDNIRFEVNLARKTEIAPDAELTFDVTFSYLNYNLASGSGDLTLNSVLNFEFRLPDEIIDDAGESIANDAMSRFAEILNDDIEYQALIDELNKSSGRNNSYIANFVGAKPTDQAFVNDIFAGNLTINIDGVDQEEKLIIKHEDIYGDSAKEMTIYMTNDPLTTGNKNAVVYVAVFTEITKDDGTTEWVQLGELFAGYAPIVDYQWGISGNNRTGSINTDRWRSNVYEMSGWFGIKEDADIESSIEQSLAKAKQ